jgi:hypothetical protein
LKGQPPWAGAAAEPGRKELNDGFFGKPVARPLALYRSGCCDCDCHAFAEKMENLIAVVLVVLFLAGILLFAKKHLKPPRGKLPDCCGPRGNRDIEV